MRRSPSLPLQAEHIFNYLMNNGNGIKVEFIHSFCVALMARYKPPKHTFRS